MPTPAQGDSLTRRMFDAWNTHDLEQVVARYHPDFYFVDPTTDRPVVGHSGLRHYAQAMFSTFPDAHFEVEDVVCDGRKEVANWIFRGTQEGVFLGCPGTGRELSFRGIDWVEYHEGLVRRNVTFYDTALILQKLGVR